MEKPTFIPTSKFPNDMRIKIRPKYPDKTIETKQTDYIVDANKMDNIYWRTGKPPKVGQYIVNIGANGISWGWWDGNNWRKLWHEYQIDVSGWLPTPLHKQQDNA
jgi:hypothetical protein